MKQTQTATITSTRKRVLLLVAAAAMIIAIIAARRCAGLNVPLVDPIVSLERQTFGDSSSDRTAGTPSNLPDDGEVYRTARRLREASALALVSALYTANEQANQRFTPDANTLIAEIRSAGLLPPGIRTDVHAMLLSDRSKLLLRFRPDPFAIEVLSFSRSREDGPALMIRIPAAGNNAEHGSVFIANRLGDIDPPSPFANLSDCVRAGWIDQAFDQAEIPMAEEQQLRAWLATKRHQ